MPRGVMVACWLVGFGLMIALLAYLLRGHVFAVLQPRGEIATRQRNLLYFASGLAVLVLLPVYFMLFTFAWRYRAGHKKAYKPECGVSLLRLSVYWR